MVSEKQEQSCLRTNGTSVTPSNRVITAKELDYHLFFHKRLVFRKVM